MYSIETLKIIDSLSEPVPNTFFRQKNETRHLAVLLPGLGYTSQMPVMYYPCLALIAKGADVLRADYNYVRRADFMVLEPEARRRLAAADAIAVYSGAIMQRDYDIVTLVGKSIGTYAMGHLITTVTHLPKLQCIWLTPLLKHEHLLSQIKQAKHKALFVTGTDDPYFDKPNLDDLMNATNGQSIVIEGADHSLEVYGDVMKSLEALEQIVKVIIKFID